MTMALMGRQSLWPFVGVDLGYDAPAPGLYHAEIREAMLLILNSLWAFVFDAKNIK